jgi:hypothetical protein
MMAMDPQSRLSTLKRMAFYGTDAGKQLVQNVGPGFSNLSSWDLDQYQQALKSGLEPSEAIAKIENTRADTTLKGATVPKTEAEARAAVAQAKGAELENGPAPEAAIAVAKRMGITLPPETTTKQARELLDAEAKRVGLNIESGRLDLERYAKAVEMQRYQFEHPDEPVPGFRWTGGAPGSAPPRESAQVQQLADKQASANSLKATLEEMRGIYNRADVQGRVVGEDAQRLRTLQGKLSGAIGRNASGGKLAEYDVVLAHGQLPDPTGWNPLKPGGAWHPKTMNAAIDAIEQMADLDLNDWARAHRWEPKGAPAPKPAAGGVTRTVNGETRAWNGSAWVKE